MSVKLPDMMPTLKELREKSGKTRANVAADLGMSERHLYRLENGYPLRRINRLNLDPDTTPSAQRRRAPGSSAG